VGWSGLWARTATVAGVQCLEGVEGTGGAKKRRDRMRQEGGERGGGRGGGRWVARYALGESDRTPVP